MTCGDSIRVENGYQSNAYTHYPVLIIGAGESGIAMGCRLKEKYGFDQFRIFDRQSGIGGTWWINRYPGVACDVPSMLYSYSFAPFYTCESIYPTGQQFVKYLHGVAAKYQIVDKIQLDTDVTELRYIENDEEWEVTLSYLVPGTGDLSEHQRRLLVTSDGGKSVYLKREKVRAKVVVSCVGILVEPNSWPANVPGRDVFEGDTFHSARWRHSIDFKDKDVVVVGSGCSAAQVVPSLFEQPFNAKSVTQLMRNPPWVMPRLEEPFGKVAYARHAPTIFRYLPFLGYLLRIFFYLIVEVIWLTIFQQKNAKWRAKLEASSLERVHSIIPKKYHEIMTPKYGYGCKRRVFDNAWLNAMSKPNFNLTTRSLKRLDTNSVVLGSDTREPQAKAAPLEDTHIHADIVVLANGFEATRWLHPLTVYGRLGKSLHDVWNERGGPQAYMGVAMDGFPNFFIATGPNTATGHSSLILESENITEYILKIVEPVLRGDALYAEPRKEAEIKWTSDIQREMKKTVFPGCTSWYQDENGWNSTMYPRSQTDFTFRCMFPRYKDWIIAYTPRGLLKRKAKQTVTYSLFVALFTTIIWARVAGPGFQRVAQDALLSLLAALKYGATELQRRIDPKA